MGSHDGQRNALLTSWFLSYLSQFLAMEGQSIRAATHLAGVILNLSHEVQVCLAAHFQNGFCRRLNQSGSFLPRTKTRTGMLAFSLALLQPVSPPSYMGIAVRQSIPRPAPAMSKQNDGNEASDTGKWQRSLK